MTVQEQAVDSRHYKQKLKAKINRQKRHKCVIRRL